MSTTSDKLVHLASTTEETVCGIERDGKAVVATGTIEKVTCKDCLEFARKGADRRYKALELRCLRCGSALANDDVTLRITGVQGSTDGTLWFHGAAAKGWGVMAMAMYRAPLEPPGDDGKMYVEPLKQGAKFCGPVVLVDDADKLTLDQDVVLGHVRAALHRTLPNEAAMRVIAYVERLVWCAVALRSVYARLGPIPIDKRTGKPRNVTVESEQIAANRLDDCRHSAAKSLRMLQAVGALTVSPLAGRAEMEGR